MGALCREKEHCAAMGALWQERNIMLKKAYCGKIPEARAQTHMLAARPAQPPRFSFSACLPLQSGGFYQLLDRLREYAAVHHRDHWCAAVPAVPAVPAGQVFQQTAPHG